MANRLLMLLLMLGMLSFGTNVTVYKPESTDDVLRNPMIGFAPRADYHDLVASNLIDCTLVYVDVTWRQLEPQKGVFDFESIESDNNLDEWRALGKRAVFRFVCDMPEDEKHMDIPDWLYEETGKDGDWYDTEYGKGYSPNYENETLIKYHAKAVKALGERYGGDDFFCYLELGSLGHWGEWHVKYSDGIKRLPKENIREQYILPYIESFPNSMIMMRRPFNAAKKYNFGIFNDMTGDKEDTETWLDWINNGGDFSQTEEKNALSAMPDAWKISPIGGEFTSSVSMKKLLDEYLETTLDLINKSHMSFIGPKCPSVNELEYKEEIEKVKLSLGYRLRIKGVVLTQFPLCNELKVNIYWVNDGIAPFYKNWDVYLCLYDNEGTQVIKTPIDISLITIVDDTPVISTTSVSIDNLSAGVYDVGVAIIDPMTNSPGVSLANKIQIENNIYLIGSWKNKKS